MVINKVCLVLALAAVLSLSACSRQQSDWQKTRTANTTDAYELFLKKYPKGEFTAQAQARVKELYEERDWQKARDTDTLEGYQAFLKQYPEGKWTEEARIRVENFMASAPSPAVADATPEQAPPQAAAPVKPAPPKTAAAPKAPLAPKAAAAPQSPASSSARAAPSKSSGAYGIQLGAFKSGADAATKRWADLQKEYPKLLAGLSPKVSPAKGAAGTLYRLQVASLSEARAGEICKTLKAHSQGCVLVHP